MMNAIAAQYQCCIPVHMLQWDFEVAELNEELLNNLLRNTVLHEICQKHPLSKVYQRSFLKHVITKLEAKGKFAPELFYTTFAEKLLEEEFETNSYKIYYVPNYSIYIPMLESTKFLCDGTTGLTTWPGSLCLAEYCLQNKEKLENKSIIELGCGVGFLGILTTLSCNPKKYEFTDCNDQVLQLLCANLSINKIQHQYIDNTNEAENVVVRNLNWSTFKVTDHNDNIDVILAADVIFDPNILKDLCKTLSVLISPPTTAYISITVRNTETYKTFLKSLEQYNLQYMEEDSTKIQKTFYYDRKVEIKILKIYASLYMA